MSIQQICDPEQCTACFACMSICPQGAIRKEVNTLGEEVPIVAPDKCVDCGLCTSVCPTNNKPVMQRAGFCYASWSKFEDDLLKSSSAGISAVLSRSVISSEGVVYGSTSAEGQVYHTRIDSADDIDKLRGSKYVKSDIRDCYSRVLDDLRSGRKVLFTGTPCQVAGLKAIVGTEDHGLFTVDLVCHGTPPFLYLKEHLDKMCVHNGTGKGWDSVSFRVRNYFLMKAYLDGKVMYQRGAADDVYYSAFLEGLIFRSNCYHCQYACPERVGDLTIGDFWGVDRDKIESDYNGKLSLILPNTQKGAALLQTCVDELNLFKLPIEDALNPEQGNLLHPSVPHKDRKLFEKMYQTHGFVGSIEKTNLGKKVLKREREKKIKGSVLYKALRRVYHILKR